MERAGTIIEVKAGTAVVRMQRHLSCANCGRCGGILGNEDRRELVVEVENPIQAGVGQKVMVETVDAQVIFISFMLYMVPLAALVAGILLWPLLARSFGLGGNQDLTAVGAGFGLMALVFLGIKQWDRRVKETGRYRPVITEMIEADETGTD
ncbi:MAG: SoxR reducing system RseC family protein [Bacillota bacterium]